MPTGNRHLPKQQIEMSTIHNSAGRLDTKKQERRVTSRIVCCRAEAMQQLQRK